MTQIHKRRGLTAAVVMGLAAFGGLSPDVWAQQRPAMAPLPAVSDDGTITTPSFELPFSSLASAEARAAFVQRLRAPQPVGADIAEIRRITDEKLARQLEVSKQRYPYTSTRSLLAGVPVETFTPTAGIAPDNAHRVLIQLHGGGFVAGGGGIGGAVESVPIAGEGRIKVVAVDYRMAPEHRFPAASEDVEKVYRELLKSYRPENIGIYGCSAGGLLTAQSVAWLRQGGLPRPGAVGIFCASAYFFHDGDSSQIWPRMGSVLRLLHPPVTGSTFPPTEPYHAGVEYVNPLALPSASKEVMADFPPTLLLTGTRSSEMSGAAQTHLDLRELGVTSELLLFDGMDHGFYSDATLPESIKAYKLIARFFDTHLGKAAK